MREKVNMSEIEISGHALPFVVMRRALSVFGALNWYLAAKLRMNEKEIWW